MANAGNSYDNILCHKITRGVYLGYSKGYSQPIPIPSHKDSDDRHQKVLKNYLIDYYNIYYDLKESNMSTRSWYGKHHEMDNIIRKMNQYRQKHWYWKAII